MKTYDFDELLTERSPAVQAAIASRHHELLRTFPLSALRTDRGRSQSDIAAALKISQAAVSKMEARSDMLLSTVYRYVKALGGGIRLAISIEDREYVIEPSDDRSTAFVLQPEHRASSPAVLFGGRNALMNQARQSNPIKRVQDMWLNKRSVLHDITIGEQIAQSANDHECSDLLAMAA